MKINAETNLEMQLSVDSSRNTRQTVGPHTAITKYGQNPLNIIKRGQICPFPTQKESTSKYRRSCISLKGKHQLLSYLSVLA